MAINVVVSQDDLTVFAAPQVVDVQVNIGPTGQRGSKIYSGVNDPTVDTTPFINDSPLLGDLFITRNTLAVWQYIAVTGANIWQKISNLSLLSASTADEVLAQASASSIFFANAASANVNTLALGYASSASANAGVLALGYASSASANVNILAVGYASSASANVNTLAVGYASSASANVNTLAVGYASSASANVNILAVGYASSASANVNTLAVGYASSASANVNTLAVGYASSASANADVLALGYASSASAHVNNYAETLLISSSVMSGSSIYIYRAPFNMNLFKTPRAYVSQASTSGSVVVDINNNGLSIFDTDKLTINENELTSVTASVSASVIYPSIVDNDLITFDIDQAGVNAQNLSIILFYKR